MLKEQITIKTIETFKYMKNYYDCSQSSTKNL